MSENYGLLLNDDKDQSIITSALELAKNQLYSFANSPDFQTKMQLAFGVAVDSNSFQIAWKNQDFSVIPNIEVRTGSELGGAIGAYAQATNTIYLSQDYLNQNAADIESITSVLLEEIGHAVDAKINIFDTPGDEGAIFSAVVQGKTFEPEQLQQLKVENDHTTITLDSQVLQVEQASIPLREGGQEGRTETITLDGKGLGSAQIFYEMYSVPDRLQLRYEGKVIFDSGFTSGSKTTRFNIPKGNSDKLDVVLTANPSINTTRWQYKIDTTTCPVPSPLEVVLVSGTEEEKDGKCILKGTINIGREGSSPILKVEGTVEYDATTISINGIVSSLIGAGLVKTMPLFKSQFDIDVKTATGSLTEDASFTNQYTLGGMDVDFSSLSINPNGLALGAKFKLIDDLGLPDYFFSGSDALLISQNDVKFGSSVKLSLPNFKDFQLFKFLPVNEFSDFSIEYVAPEDKIKIQGKLVIDPFAKPDEKTITADFAGDNFIQIQGGKADVKGSLAVKDQIKPGKWGLSEVKLDIDTQNKDIGGSAKIVFPFGAKFPPNNSGDLTLGLGFKLPPVELNKVSIKLDNLNVRIPIPSFPFVYFQRVAASVDNWAKSDPDPVEWSGGLGATLGPQFTISGDKYSLIRLDVDAKISSEQLSANGNTTFINDKIVSKDGTVTLNWNKRFYEEKGNFSLFDGFIKTNSGFRTDSSLNIKMNGSASVGIPNFVPLFGGSQLASGNYLLDFSNDGNLSNDFAAAWGTLNIQKFGFEVNMPVGAKLYFDGHFEHMGAKDLPPVGSWAVAANTPWILLSAAWENEIGANVPVQIETPDGRLLNESEFSANNIAFVDELTNLKTKTVIIFNPTEGIWDIEVPDKTGLGSITYNAVTNSQAPTIEITAPVTDITDQNVTISYNAFDSDSNAKVSLFYDTDNQGFDGILIKDSLTETDGAGSFIWNTEGITTGDYYIYGMAMDENNPIALSYGTGRVKVTEAADLSVTTTANTDSVNVGDNLTYTIAVTNNGINNAKGITLTDTLPDGVTFVSASISPTAQSDSSLIFDLGNLEKGKSTTVNVTITPLVTGTLTNTTTVTAKTYDPDATNDTTILDTTVTTAIPFSPDLVLTTNASDAPVNLGDKINYILTVTNNGDGQATGIKLTDNIGSLGVKDVLTTSSQGTASIDSNGNVTAQLGKLNKGEKATVTITATSIVADTLINTAFITSNEDDFNTTNNFLIQSQAVNAITPTSADLELTQTIDNPNPKIGDEVNFTLTLTNKGVGIASSIKVKDILSSDLDFVSALPEQGTYDSQTGLWDVGNMRDNLTRTLKLTAKANKDVSITNTAEIIAVAETDPDSTPNNNNPNEDDQASVTLNAALATPTLTKITDDIFTISGNKPKLQVTPAGRNSNLVNELGVFTVDDAQGKINGIAPGETGYTQAALNKSKVIFSTIANVPNGFDINNLTSLIEFESGNNLRFLLVKNGTVDSVQNGITPTSDILFSDLSRQKITDLGTDGFSLAWKDGSNNNTDFKDLVVNIKSTDDSLPLGTNLQGKQQGEVLDLRGITQDVKADFTVNREAAFNNFVGFYKVADENGGIDVDGNGTVDFRPGDSGYAQAAIKSRVAGIDLTVNNQGTASFTDKTLTGGSIFAPFILTNGRTVDQVLNGQVDQAYFAYLGANSDKVDHIRLLGNNVFGFEDLAGGGDNDYNDIIVKVNLSVV
ncbi:hypothetical protein ANA_C13352 [Anabaena sp. 90]|uniref:DUF4114 domain-containing protein n=1 Tax=Anabaena sp. 90 TaxID=46234 RepID=UPI00029B77B4|nr:DUF4114 domain-containing protein [Anabaena sp. 90]AFW96022.1 hypothetical protein ANA_C13352 [Anabaena sp. 90]